VSLANRYTAQWSVCWFTLVC